MLFCHKSHMDLLGTETGPSRCEAGDWPPDRYRVACGQSVSQAVGQSVSYTWLAADIDM